MYCILSEVLELVVGLRSHSKFRRCGWTEWVMKYHSVEVGNRRKVNINDGKSVPTRNIMYLSRWWDQVNYSRKSPVQHACIYSTFLPETFSSSAKAFIVSLIQLTKRSIRKNRLGPPDRQREGKCKNAKQSHITLYVHHRNTYICT